MRVEWFCCSCLLRFVPENSRPIRPNLHTPNNWHLRVCWHNSFGLAKASKVCAARWHMICNSTTARNAGIDFLYPNSGRWKHNFLCPKRPWPVCQQPLCCWCVLDEKVDLGLNLHSVAKSGGSWFQEKVERGKFSSADRMPQIQYHAERPCWILYTTEIMCYTDVIHLVHH